MSEDREMQSLASTVDNVRLQEQQYQRQVSTIQKLIDSMRQKLQQAKQDLRRAVSHSVNVFYDDLWLLLPFL